MRIVRYVCGLVSALCLLGCVTGDQRDRPFSDDWTRQIKHDRAFERRKARIRGEGEVVIVGDREKARAAIVMDESGDPKLNVGRQTGWSADLDYDHGPEGEVKYKYEWDFVKPKHRKERVQ